MRYFLTLLLLLISFPVFGQNAESIRTWKDTTGNFSIKATFVKMSGDLVVLQRSDQQQLSIPLVKLSANDQQYVRKRHAEIQRYMSARIVTPQQNLASIIANAPNNSVIKLTAGIFHLQPQQPHQQGVLIQNKRGLIITGSGRDQTTVKLATHVDVGFLIGSKVEDLKIENLHIQGTPPLTINTAGIGSTSICSEVRNVTLTNLSIDQVAVGIFMATNKGPVRNLQITNNIVTNTIGTDAGWGYGIHTRNIGNVEITHNYIEHATRHSIYVRESPKHFKLIVQDNFILNHDLKGKNPRWYCAALNCPDNQGITRISDNYFINTNAIGIAVMLTANDLELVNNQIIGEHYIGIWPVTGEIHKALGNSILLHSNPVHPEWCHKISYFDWPNGKKTTSRLEPPNARWEQPDFICRLGGDRYIMKDGRLDKITHTTWAFQSAPNNWSDVKGMCAVENVRGSGSGKLYIITEAGFFEVNPENWEFTKQAGDWRGTRFMAATNNHVHVLKGSTLHSINLMSLEMASSSHDWTAVQWMCAWNNQLYLYDGQAHYRVNPKTLEQTLISQPPK